MVWGLWDFHWDVCTSIQWHSGRGLHQHSGEICTSVRVVRRFAPTCTDRFAPAFRRAVCRLWRLCEDRVALPLWSPASEEQLTAKRCHGTTLSIPPLHPPTSAQTSRLPVQRHSWLGHALPCSVTAGWGPAAAAEHACQATGTAVVTAQPCGTQASPATCGRP